jgi:hypothetical protein
MIEAIIREAPERVENVIELGIFKGGSVSFLQEMFRPRRLVGLDRYKRPPAGPLEVAFCRARNGEGLMRSTGMRLRRSPIWQWKCDHGGQP